jgi:hypothetical protein
MNRGNARRIGVARIMMSWLNGCLKVSCAHRRRAASIGSPMLDRHSRCGGTQIDRNVRRHLVVPLHA